MLASAPGADPEDMPDIVPPQEPAFGDLADGCTRCIATQRIPLANDDRPTDLGSLRQQGIDVVIISGVGRFPMP